MKIVFQKGLGDSRSQFPQGETQDAWKVLGYIVRQRQASICLELGDKTHNEPINDGYCVGLAGKITT